MLMLPRLSHRTEQQGSTKQEPGAAIIGVDSSQASSPRWHTTDIPHDIKTASHIVDDTDQRDGSRKRLRFMTPAQKTSMTRFPTGGTPSDAGHTSTIQFTSSSKDRDDSQQQGVSTIDHDEEAQAVAYGAPVAVPKRPAYQSTFDSGATITMSMYDRAPDAYSDDMSTTSSLDGLHAAIPYQHSDTSFDTTASPLDVSQLPDKLWFDLSSPEQYDQQDLFQITYDAVQLELAKSQQTIENFTGSDADIGALLHRKLYKRAARLSQIIADLLKELLPHETFPSATTVAIMWLHWHMWRWILAPSSENYKALPKVIRPTAAQRAAPHALAIDFLILPKSRTAACAGASDLHSSQADYYASITLHGPQTTLHALCKDAATQKVILTQSSRTQAAESVNWSQAWMALLDHNHNV